MLAPRAPGLPVLFALVAATAGGCASANGQGLAVTVGDDPLDTGAAKKKVPPPPPTEGTAPKERTLASLLPGPPDLESGTVRVGYTTAPDGGEATMEREESRRFFRARYTDLVVDETVGHAEPERRRLLGTADVVYEVGDGRCTAWRTERAAEQIAAGPPPGKLGTRPYPAAFGSAPVGPLARFSGPFRGRLMAADDTVEGRRADRYGVSLGAASDQLTGTAEVWVLRPNGRVSASRGEILVPSLGPDGLEDSTRPGSVESWAAVVVEGDVPDDLELPDDCKRAVVQPADAR